MPCRVKSYSANKHERTEFPILVRDCRDFTETLLLGFVNSKIRSPVPNFRISENFFGQGRRHNHCYFSS